jgi:hypothetical protein
MHQSKSISLLLLFKTECYIQRNSLIHTPVLILAAACTSEMSEKLPTFTHYNNQRTELMSITDHCENQKSVIGKHDFFVSFKNVKIHIFFTLPSAINALGHYQLREIWY